MFSDQDKEIMYLKSINHKLLMACKSLRSCLSKHKGSEYWDQPAIIKADEAIKLAERKRK